MADRIEFDIRRVNRLRNAATSASSVPNDGADGWSKSGVDPMEVLAVFKALQIKPGHVLRAYQFRSGGNGHGVVWAMLLNAPFLEPVDCKREEDFEFPRPLESLDDVMSAINGDGTPWSYLSASIFSREASELGAMWHGCNWGTHKILGSAPKAINAPRTRDQWEWKRDPPKGWLPAFESLQGQKVVSFYSLSELGAEAIYLHTDTFDADGYTFTSTQDCVAVGGSGYVF